MGKLIMYAMRLVMKQKKNLY